MAGKVGCALLLAVLFAAAAVSRTSFAVFLAALAVLLVQRRWMLFFAAGTFFARIPLVFLTAPDTYFMYYLTPFYRRVCGGGGCGAVRSAETEIEIGKDHGLMLALFLLLALLLVLWAMRSACCGGSSSSAFMSARSADRCCAAWPAAMR